MNEIKREDTPKAAPRADLASIVFQALGEASMCWDQVPAGVFDSTKAKEIGERLMRRIAGLLGWIPIDTAPKDGTAIIYLAPEPKCPRDPWFVGEAIWRDSDEGHDEGWWDESLNMDVAPTYWMPSPPRPTP